MFTINLNNINKVKQFVQDVQNIEFDIVLKNNRYIVDAKSIMGVFSLNLSEPVILSAVNDITDEQKEQLFNIAMKYTCKI